MCHLYSLKPWQLSDYSYNPLDECGNAPPNVIQIICYGVVGPHRKIDPDILNMHCARQADIDSRPLWAPARYDRQYQGKLGVNDLGGLLIYLLVQPENGEVELMRELPAMTLEVFRPVRRLMQHIFVDLIPDLSGEGQEVHAAGWELRGEVHEGEGSGWLVSDRNLTAPVDDGLRSHDELAGSKNRLRQ